MLWLKVITIISLVGVAVGHGGYQNDYQGELMVECPSGYGLSRVESRYVGPRTKRNVQADRLWYWGCKKINYLKQDYCEWTEPINDAGEPMFFQCPPDAFMAGVRSTYDRDFYDRVWEVKCCRILSVCMQHCYLSDVLANFADDMPRYRAGRDGVFVGMYSEYNSGYEDREYRLAACQFDDCYHPKKEYKYY